MERGYLDFERLQTFKFKHPGTRKILVFLTDNFTLPPLTITKIYRSRCKVELFFNWIKQHQKIKNFYGTTENGVMTQA
jgi:IS4 transposase